MIFDMFAVFVLFGFKVEGCAHGMHAFCDRTHPSSLLVSNIGAEGAVVISRALEKNSTLHSLNLDCECVAVLRSCFCVFAYSLCLREG